jgi:general secretion pathway protein A
MYKAFYGLSRFPFSKEMDTREAFTSTPFQEAKGRLDYLKTTRGIGLLTGEAGSGKTFTLRSFTASLASSLYKVIYFPLSTGTVVDFYRGLVYELGEAPKFRKVDLFRQIQAGIEHAYHQRRITPVFVLDEMHMATSAFLNELSVLFNFRMDAENPFLLVLIGLPYLEDRLRLNQHRPLTQRLLVRSKMKALNKDEVTRYIEHQMDRAGAKTPLFQETAMEAIASSSQGWPRMINTLAEHSLLCGYQLKKEQIDAEVVRRATEEVGL